MTSIELPQKSAGFHPIYHPQQCWTKVQPGEHIVQIYESDLALLDSLENFVVGGLRLGESIIAVATTDHCAELYSRLNGYGIDPQALRKQFICLDAEATLAKFMVRGWPDEQLFANLLTETLEQARKGGRRVRAFGEMVAILWKNGHNEATLKLEHLWNKFCHTGELSLLCAYPKLGFTSKSKKSAKDICAAHSKVITERDWLPA